jgi:DNA-binding SARP family transcriptional activator
MRFSILGPLLAEADDGTPVVFTRPSQRSTLAVLLLHARHPPTRSVLIDALWGDNPPADADAALRVRMCDLRRALGGSDRLVTHQCGYRVLAEPGELDAALFEELAARGRAALDTGRMPDAARLLARAAGLWRAPPLADLPDTPSMQLIGTALLEQRRDVQEWLIDARLALGQHREALAEIRASIVAEPLAEHSYVQLMLALYRSGQKSAALAAYTRLRELTAREFGQDPGPEARDLLSQILADSPDLGLRPWLLPLSGLAQSATCPSADGRLQSGVRRPARARVRLCRARSGPPARSA